MDYQALFNIAVSILAALGGWILRVAYDMISKLQGDIKCLDDEMAKNYVRRDDFKDTVTALFSKLDRIEEKLDRKVDK